MPVLNEAERVRDSIMSIRSLDSNVEIIIVDGLSDDNTLERAKACGVSVYSSNPGRGVQCNVGAEHASGDVLIFQHIDSTLPQGALELIKQEFSRTDVQVGTFRMRFDLDHWFLNMSGYLTRFDSILTRFGDQCIVVRKDFFNELGRFPDWPLFEDVEFLRRARKKTRIWSFPLEVMTSARRFKKNGIYRQQIFNGLLVLQYFLGVDVKKLAEKYRNLGGRNK